MPKQVFIADDNKTVRNILKFLLTQRTTDLEVCGEAANGVQAVVKGRALKPDLILLDLAMPEMDGAEAASLLKKLMPDVPIILFTMHGENIRQYLKSAVGVDAVLSKPDGVTVLFEAIDTVFASNSSSIDPTAAV
jgi:DNA-binding NarL/FixJ family response regulator